MANNTRNDTVIPIWLCGLIVGWAASAALLFGAVCLGGPFDDTSWLQRLVWLFVCVFWPITIPMMALFDFLEEKR
jgi:hypothetical protein